MGDLRGGGEAKGSAGAQRRRGRVVLGLQEWCGQGKSVTPFSLEKWLVVHQTWSCRDYGEDMSDERPPEPVAEGRPSDEDDEVRRRGVSRRRLLGGLGVTGLIAWSAPVVEPNGVFRRPTTSPL